MQPIFVHTNWQATNAIVTHRRDRTRWVILGWLLVLLVAVGTVQRIVPRLVFKAILTDGINWGIATGVLVWYALRYRPERKQVAIVCGLCVVGIFFLVNSVPKWNLTDWPPQGRMDAPILYWGLWHLLFWGLLHWLLRHYPREMHAIGLHHDNLWRDIGAGLIGGTILAGHFIFSIPFTGARALQFPPLPYIVWQLSFEAVATLCTELFFRAVIYHHLESEWQWDYWQATLLSATATTALFLVKTRWTTDTITIIGVIFYSIMLTLINSALYRWTRNLLPGYVAAMIFHFTAMLI